MDLSKEIREAVKTGKVIFGSDKSIKAVKQGHAKLVIISSTVPEEIRADVERYAKMANIPVRIFKGDSSELGLACGKPFLVSTIAILDPGTSGIMNFEGDG